MLDLNQFSSITTPNVWVSQVMDYVYSPYVLLITWRISMVQEMGHLAKNVTTHPRILENNIAHNIATSISAISCDHQCVKLTIYMCVWEMCDVVVAFQTSVIYFPTNKWFVTHTHQKALLILLMENNKGCAFASTEHLCWAKTPISSAEPIE
jgi:hypothetical protein